MTVRPPRKATMHRPWRVLTAALLACAIALTGCARTPTDPVTASSKATVGLTYIPDIQFAPFYVAEAQGLFTERGVQATLRHHGANEGLFTALMAGEEDFVVAGGDEMVQARAQGMDLVAIAQYYRRYPVVAIVPDASDVRTAADLRGRSVGVPGRYGESWFGLLVLLADAGLTVDDVEIVEIGYTQQVALATGKVEAIIGFSNNDQVQFEASGIPVRAVPLTASGDVPLVSIVLVTRAETLTSNPGLAKRVADAMVAGIDRTVKQPASAVEASRKHIPTLASQPGAEAAASRTLTATVALWTSSSGGVSGKLDPDAWAKMTAFMLAKGLISTPVEAAKAMTNDHVSA